MENFMNFETLCNFAFSSRKFGKMEFLLNFKLQNNIKYLIDVDIGTDWSVDLTKPDFFY